MELTWPCHRPRFICHLLGPSYIVQMSRDPVTDWIVPVHLLFFLQKEFFLFQALLVTFHPNVKEGTVTYVWSSRMRPSLFILSSSDAIGWNYLDKNNNNNNNKLLKKKKKPSFLQCYHYGLHPYLNFKCCMLIGTVLMVLSQSQHLYTTYHHCEYLISAKTCF